MRFIFKYVRNYKKEVLFCLGGAIALVAILLGLPLLLAEFIDKGIILHDEKILQATIVKMTVLVVGSSIFLLLSRYGLATLSSGVTRDIRNDVYQKMINLSQHEFQEFGVSTLSNRITTDAFIILQFVQNIFGLGLTAPLVMLFAIGMIAEISLPLGLQLLPTLPVFVLMIWLLSKVTLPISGESQKTIDDINRNQREAIRSLRVVRAFNRQDYVAGKFSLINERYRCLTAKLFKILAVPPAAAWLIIDLSLILVIFSGAQFISYGDLQLGDLVAFIQYVMEALFSIALFINVIIMYPKAMVSADRLREVLETEISIKNCAAPIMATDNSGRLEFRNVNFIYPDAQEPVLRNISFTVNPGETVAFIGSTGSGKSTIVKLIPRFYDVSDGEILLDGINIKDLDLHVLRAKIGYTPQKANLFTGEIQDNLKFGYEFAGINDMLYAVDIAQAREFIDKTPEGFETYLSEGGNNLSGGQKQRLSIARSIIGEHEVYIFDDSFSALDYKTDAQVRQALHERIKNASTIIVAQRIATIMQADKIIVLDRGTIAAQGRHEELLQTSQLYREIAHSQLSEEELNA